MSNLSWGRWFCEDLIAPMRAAAPLTCASTVALAIMLPFIIVGDVYLSSLWFANSSVPPILMPLIIMLTLFAVLLTVGSACAIILAIVIIVRVVQHGKELRLKAAAVPRRERCLRMWAALTVTVRLANLKACGAGSGTGSAIHWKDAWHRVAKARAGRRRRLATEELDLNGWTQRACSPLIVLVMWSLIAFGQHTFYTIALPWFKLGTYLKLAVLPSTAVVAVRMFVDYVRVVLMDPGRPSTATATELSAFAEIGSYGPEEGKAPRWCGRCQAPKPFRTHHCRICRRCVLKMDHHCVFVSNCVGLRNYRYFCLLLLEIAFGSFVLAICLLPQLPRVFGFVRSRGIDWKYRVHVIAAFLVAAGGAGLLGPFFRTHLRMVLRGETTLEKMIRDDQKQEEKKQQKSKNGSLAAPGHGPISRDTIGNCRSPMENFCEVFGVPPAWSRRYVESLIGWLTSQRSAKRSE